MEILGEINRGGFGRVERVLLDDGRTAARKVFDPAAEILRTADADKLRRRFQREVRVQSALQSSFVVPIVEVDLDGNPPWFAMPLAEANLDDHIRETRQSGDVPKKALADILNGLEHLHRLGYVHRDLKPGNVLLHDGRWKLSGFGLVLPSTRSTTALTATYSAWGTADYCAPEQAQDFRNATAAVDIYAFGCILHDIFVGTPRVPYRQQSGPGPIGYIIEKCTDVQPRRRFKTVAALRGSLLAQLSANAALLTDPTAEEWSAALERVGEWDLRKFEEFVRFLRRAEDEDLGLWPVFRQFDEDTIQALYDKDAELWQAAAESYGHYARGSFDFAYCDVVVRRLEAIFQLGEPATKAISAVSAAILGRSHNRWFVMGRVMELCGPALDESIAQRIAIEIEVEEAQEDFVLCARMIGRSAAEYHPIIARRVEEQAVS